VAEIVKSTIQKRDSRGVIRHGAEWLVLWSDPDSMKSVEEKRLDASVNAAQREVERCLAAAARSIARDPGLQITFPLSPSPERSELSALRGAIDSIALTRRFHSPLLHQQWAPSEPSRRRLFDLCENVRCEALGARLFTGVRENLAAHHLDRLRRSGLLNAHLASLVPLGEGLRMVLRDTLLERSEPSIDSSAFLMWDQWLRSRFSNDLGGLQSTLGDQAAYSSLSLEWIGRLIEALGSDEGLKRRFTPTGRPPEDAGEDEDSQEDLRSKELREEPNGEVMNPGSELFLEDEHELAAAATHEPPAEPLSYTAFTTAHDLVARPADLVEVAGLKDARHALEKRRSDFRRDFGRLVNRLQRRLLARRVREWEFDADEGLIDASRLDRVVVNPGFVSVYKRERESEFRDTVVSLLIDNSGSMRGKPIEIACLAVDMISAALERCGVTCEILGFTTRAWKGGESAKDWVRSGRPAEPGRLNDLLHIIYKSADEPCRRSRLNLCAMLDPDLLRENIDGEALLWASRRLLMRPESRRILIVISDGAPADQATLDHNADKNILDRHLRKVITAIEDSSAIELAAIGVKHEAGRYYRHAVQIPTIDNLGASLVEVVDSLLLQ